MLLRYSTVNMGDENNTNEKPARAPELYQGDENEWPEWSAVVRSYMRRHGSDVPGLLRQAERTETVLELSEMTDEAKKKAGKVMSDLTSLTRGNALRLISSLEGTPEEDNGFEAWRLLYYRATGGGTQKGLGMLTHILEYNFNDGFYLDRLTEWEALVRRYERTLDVAENIPDSVLRAAVQKQAPEALKKQLVQKADTLKTWPQMRAYIEEFYNVQRAYTGRPSKRAAKSSNDMEVDALNQKGKDGKGKGKQSFGGKDFGKGASGFKGQGGKKGVGKSGKAPGKGFHGYCGYCNGWGHKASECWHDPKNKGSGKPNTQNPNGSGKGTS